MTYCRSSRNGQQVFLTWVHLRKYQQHTCRPSSCRTLCWAEASYQMSLMQPDQLMADARSGDNNTMMISANFQGLVASHNQPHFLVLFMCEQTQFTCSTLLPLCSSRFKPEQLSSPVDMASHKPKRRMRV